MFLFLQIEIDFMNILGLSHLAPSPFGHDSSVALLDDDFNLFAISEERV